VSSLEKLGRIKPETADDDIALYAEYVPPPRSEKLDQEPTQ
jgi:hypothetical protein